jgi:hypothetical protein
MKFDSTNEDRVRTRAYEIYEQHSRAARNAFDDWLQAEAELGRRRDETALEPAGEGGWRNIEPLLKWGAVAYGFGFLTVMWHTRALGIPVIQLVEPINVWIGSFLAVVLFFLDKIVARVKGASEELAEAIRAAKKQREEMRNWSDPQKLYDAIIATFDQAYLLFRRPSSWVPKRALQSARRELETLFDENATPQQKRADLLKQWGILISSFNALIAVRKFIYFVVYVALVFIACAVYVTNVYPQMPQSIGGGKPMSVRLIVNTEKISKDAA